MTNACGKLLFQELERMTMWLQEVDKQFNLCTPQGLQAREIVSEPLCSREGMPFTCDAGKELLINR